MIPKDAIEIELDYGGYSSCSDCCNCGSTNLELWITLVDGKRTMIWESSHYGSDEWDKHIELRNELIEIFEKLNLDINKVVDLKETCIYDWEYKECLQA